MRLESISRFAAQNKNQAEAGEDAEDMFRPEITVTFAGFLQSLKSWCNDMGGCYGTIYSRWRRGVRNEEELLMGTRLSRKEITEDDLEYLRETKYARSGQPNEWLIACDLIGVPHNRAKELKEALG